MFQLYLSWLEMNRNWMKCKISQATGKQPALQIVWYSVVGIPCDAMIWNITNSLHYLIFCGQKCCNLIVWTVNNSIVYIDFHLKKNSLLKILARSCFAQNVIHGVQFLYSFVCLKSHCYTHKYFDYFERKRSLYWAC